MTNELSLMEKLAVSKKIMDAITGLSSVTSISQESLQPIGESKITDQNFKGDINVCK